MYIHISIYTHIQIFVYNIYMHIHNIAQIPHIDTCLFMVIQVWGHGRRLSCAEIARLCGMKPDFFVDMRPGKFQTAMGNMMPVPLIGSVLIPVLSAVSCFERALTPSAILKMDDGGVRDYAEKVQAQRSKRPRTAL